MARPGQRPQGGGGGSWEVFYQTTHRRIWYSVSAGDTSAKARRYRNCLNSYGTWQAVDGRVAITKASQHYKWAEQNARRLDNANK